MVLMIEAKFETVPMRYFANRLFLLPQLPCQLCGLLTRNCSSMD
jgi:hypothetical protein